MGLCALNGLVWSVVGACHIWHLRPRQAFAFPQPVEGRVSCNGRDPCVELPLSSVQVTFGENLHHGVVRDVVCVGLIPHYAASRSVGEGGGPNHEVCQRVRALASGFGDGIGGVNGRDRGVQRGPPFWGFSTFDGWGARIFDTRQGTIGIFE